MEQGAGMRKLKLRKVSAHVNHGSEDEIINARAIAYRMLAAVDNTPSQPVRRIYDQVVQGEENLEDVPNFRTVRTQLERRRASHAILYFEGAILPNPTTVEDVVIPDEWARIWGGRQFLSYQDNDWGILVFGTNRNFRKLRHCSVLYMDGTFKTCPRPWKSHPVRHGADDDQDGRRILPGPPAGDETSMSENVSGVEQLTSGVSSDSEESSSSSDTIGKLCLVFCMQIVKGKHHEESQQTAEREGWELAREEHLLKQKDDSPKPMGTHITGAIDHGLNNIYAAIDVQNFPHDTNLTIAVLMKALQHQAKNDGEWIQSLHLHASAYLPNVESASSSCNLDFYWPYTNAVLHDLQTETSFDFVEPTECTAIMTENLSIRYSIQHVYDGRLSEMAHLMELYRRALRVSTTILASDLCGPFDEPLQYRRHRLLVPTQVSNAGQKAEDTESGESPDYPKHDLSLDLRTTAFLIYHFIYAKRHPAHTCQLVSYLSLIHTMATRGAQWRRYDKMFHAEDTFTSKQQRKPRQFFQTAIYLTNVVIKHHDNFTYYNKRKAMADNWSGGYFHANDGCIKPRYPDFDPEERTQTPPWLSCRAWNGNRRLWTSDWRPSNGYANMNEMMSVMGIPSLCEHTFIHTEHTNEEMWRKELASEILTAGIEEKKITVYEPLALACCDTSADLKAIKEVLLNVWKWLSYSPKRTAAFVKCQLAIKGMAGAKIPSA
ncbi:hypothetical protein Bbelb_187180 [Branchiostoma belcheri]|nr:hypothetical protein Bbelb_187180 [Branchiostoma belcheri]